MQDYIRKWNASFLRTVYLKPNKLYYDFLFVNVYYNSEWFLFISFCYVTMKNFYYPKTIHHYKTYLPNCHITIYDNESTDNSVNIAKQLGCSIVSWKKTDEIDDFYEYQYASRGGFEYLLRY
jgi:hypothetical protein